MSALRPAKPENNPVFSSIWSYSRGYFQIQVFPRRARVLRPCAFDLQLRHGESTRAEVDFAPDATIHVSAVEDEATNHGATTRELVAEAERAHIRQALASEFVATVGPRLAGARPVVARIRISRFYVPGAVAALMVGGSSDMQAGVDLVDEKSGEILVSIPPGKISNSVYRPGGILGVAVQVAGAGDPVDAKTREMSRKFSAEYAQWLMER